VITLTRTGDVGAVLRALRHRAGLSIRQLAVHAHVSKSGIAKRENHPGMTLGTLIDHAQALDHTVALVPTPRPGTRPTGTGWPA
jgi:transcriptional regulator with XRE-family HTH domain